MTDPDAGPRSRRLGRRRFLSIAAAAAGCALLPGSSGAVAPIQVWRGAALGARASIRIADPDRGRARRMIARAVAEIARLERIFSLYDPASALSALNRDGRLADPPLELLELLSQAAEISALTDGAFDVTVQPLWRRYAEHFASAPKDGGAPRLDDVLPLVDWRQLALAPDLIAFGRAGMAATLNGIAQGFVTDRVAELLRREGLGSLLLDLGELRALGRHPEGRAWRVGIEDPAKRGRIAGRLALEDRALASSGGRSLPFDPAGRFSHLIDPRTGRTAPGARGITVAAESATRADAVSTAFSLMPVPEIARRLAAQPGLRAWLVADFALREIHPPQR